MNEDSVDQIADADQAHAELEACLRAAAKVHGARIQLYWTDLGSRARLTIAFNGGEWRPFRLGVAKRASHAVAGTMLACCVMWPIETAFRAHVTSAVFALCALVHFVCAYLGPRMKVARITDVIKTATRLADHFDIDAKWHGDARWEIRYCKRYTS